MSLTRRNFLATTSMAGSALLLTAMDTFAELHKPIFTMNNSFELKVMATNWGFQGSLDSYCALAKKEGYDGIEIWWPPDKKSQDELFNALQKNKLDVGFLVGG